MAQLIIEVLKQEARVNSAVFPMFAGFASAQEIKTIASVPGFSHNKEHQQIATDLLHPPIDEWQRPLDQSRVRKIKAVYNSTIKNNLMPNPVLLGATSANLDPQNDISLLVRSKTMPVPNGSIIVPNLYEIIIDYDPNNPKKPIWILDGQHRIEGMFSSSQRTQPIPFILLYDTTGNSYTPSFLAEIFTHVTTGAKPMDNIHQEWMKYSFDLPSYDEIATKNALTTVIHLCSTQTFGTINNPFINQIQFNPRKRKPGYYGFKFDMIEWSNIMRENYFGLGGSLPPIELAEEIVKAIKALEGLDSYYLNGSKLFSESNHTILAEGLLCGLLRFLASNNTRSWVVLDWNNFLTDSLRRFNQCDWSFSTTITSSDAMSGGNVSKVSKDTAIKCFDCFFNNANILQGALITDYLMGQNASFDIISFDKDINENIVPNTLISNTIAPGGTTNIFNIRTNDPGFVRKAISVKSTTPNCHITGVYYTGVNPPIQLRDATKETGQDIVNILQLQHAQNSQGNRSVSNTGTHGRTNVSIQIAVETMGYSRDSIKQTILRIDGEI